MDMEYTDRKLLELRQIFFHLKILGYPITY